MQRMVRESGEEVETNEQTISSLKDGYTAEHQKVQDGHAEEPQMKEE